METVLILAVAGVICIFCFLVGAKVGQQVSRGENVQLPELNPVAGIRQHKARKQAEQEQNRRDTILRNIDKYDGSGLGQEDVPGG